VNRSILIIFFFELGTCELTNVIGMTPFRYDEAKEEWIEVLAMYNAMRSMTQLISPPSDNVDNEIIVIGCSTHKPSSYSIFERYNHATIMNDATTLDNDNDHNDGDVERKTQQLGQQYSKGEVGVDRQTLKWSSLLAKCQMPLPHFLVFDNKWLILPSYDIESPIGPHGHGHHGGDGGSGGGRMSMVRVNDIDDNKQWRWYESIPKGNEQSKSIKRLQSDPCRPTCMVITGDDLYDGLRSSIV
jgi:hypothetical protein